MWLGAFGVSCPSDDAVALYLPIRPIEHREWMRLGVEDPVVERNEILVREQEVQIFEPVGRDATRERIDIAVRPEDHTFQR